MSKGKDISTMFTKEENKKNGRLGYCQATREKDTIAVGWNACINAITGGNADD